MSVKYVMGICAIVAVSFAFTEAASAADSFLGKGEYTCHEKETKMLGACKKLRHGFCTFTADATTVKALCKYFRRG